MKGKNGLLGVLAVALVFAMTAVGCGEVPVDDNKAPQPIKFISSDGAGTTYTLTITPGKANTVAAGDSYTLTITSGGKSTVSKGTITDVSDDGELTMQPNNSGSPPEFTITVTSDGQMTDISGTITVGNGEGTKVTAPGTVTPGTGGSGGTVTNSTFTLTGIPAEFNGKYARLLASSGNGPISVAGYQSVSVSTIPVLCQISKGSVSLPLWSEGATPTPVKYTGNDTLMTGIQLYNNQAVTDDDFDSPIGTIIFSSVTFSKGGATRSWSQGEYRASGEGGGEGNGGGTAVTLTGVTADGSATQTTTQLTLTFSQAITGLTAADITVSGVSGVSKGTLSGNGPSYTLPISGFSAGGTLSVAVAKSGYTISGSPKEVSVYYSSGGGETKLTWTAILDTSYSSSSDPVHSPLAIAYGYGKFVGVEYSTSGLVISTDGVTWSDRTPSFYSTQPKAPIIWGNDKFVAGATNSNSNWVKMAYSYEGSDWKSIAITTSASITSIAYGNGKFVAGLGNGSMVYSSDGVTWTTVANSTFGTSAIYGIAYGNDIFVAVGESGKIAYSSDGVTWNAVENSPAPATRSFDAIAYGNGKFVSVFENSMVYSSDGATWTVAATNVFGMGTHGVFTIAYGNNMFVAEEFYGRIAASTDGKTWTVKDGPYQRNNLSYSRGDFNISYANGKFFATARYMSGTTNYVKLYVSDDGGGDDTAVTLSSVTPNGSDTVTTTQLTLTFSQAITGLTADDITVSGVTGVSKGTLSGTGPTYTLPISGFSAGGTLTVAVAKEGYTISGSPKTVSIYYYSGSGGGSLNGTWVNTNGLQWIFTDGNYETKEKAPADPSYICTSSKGTYTTSGTSITLTPTHQYDLVSSKEGNNPWVHNVYGGTREEYTAYIKSPAGIEEYGQLTDAEITAELNQIFSPINFTYSLDGNTLTVTLTNPENGQSSSTVFTRQS